MAWGRLARLLLLCILILSLLSACASPQQRLHDGERFPRLFGATYMTMNNPYFEVLNDSLADVIESNGDILLARDPSRDQEKQNQQIEEMIREGISVLFLNPVDWKGVRPALEACRAAGVAVINIDTLVYDREYVLSTIESDNYGAGVLCAEDMMRKRQDARIVVLNSDITTSIIERVQGFLDTIADHPEYQVVHTDSCDGELEISLEVMGDILSSGLAFDVVLGGNDPTALGALAALQQHQWDGQTLIYGIDGSPDFKSVLKAGYVEGTSVQSPRTIGTTAAEIAYQYLAGEDVEEYVRIPVTLLTRENLDGVDIHGWQ